MRGSAPQAVEYNANLTALPLIGSIRWLVRTFGTIKTPEKSNPLNAKMASIANAAIMVHSIHRLRNMRSERMKAAAAKMPNSGNAMGPYVTANQFTKGKLCSMPMP